MNVSNTNNCICKQNSIAINKQLSLFHALLLTFFNSIDQRLANWAPRRRSAPRDLPGAPRKHAKVAVYVAVKSARHLEVLQWKNTVWKSCS